MVLAKGALRSIKLTIDDMNVDFKHLYFYLIVSNALV